MNQKGRIKTRTKRIIDGRFSEYYECEHKIARMEAEIEEIRNGMSGVHAIRYDKQTASASGSNDERLASMINKISHIEAEIKLLNMKMTSIAAVNHFDQMNEEEAKIVRCVYDKGMSYNAIGNLIGVTRITVYRIMLNLYKRMEEYI